MVINTRSYSVSIDRMQLSCMRVLFVVVCVLLLLPSESTLSKKDKKKDKEIKVYHHHITSQVKSLLSLSVL